MRIVNSSSARKSNLKVVLNCLRFNGSLSASDIGALLNVPSGTVSRVSNYLLERKLIRVAKAKKNKSVGKPPIRLELNPDYALIAGLELNELSTNILLSDFKGKVLLKKSRPTKKSLEDIPSSLSELIESSVRELGLPDIPLKGVGIGVSGGVSNDNQKVMWSFLPKDYELPRMLAEKLKVPVNIDNDANLAVIAEKMFGKGKTHENILCLLDRGWVGLGIYLNNQIYRGKNNAAGELLAHVSSGTSVPVGNLCRTPFIESFGLESMMRETGYLDFSKFPSRGKVIEFLSKRAEDNDNAARNILEKECMRFSEALFRLSVLFDPDLLVVAGDICSAGKLAEDNIKKMLAAKTAGISKVTPEFSFSYLEENNPVALGAAFLSIGKLTDSLIENNCV